MNDTLERWIQGVTLAAVLAVAATLLTVGVVLYSSQSEAHGTADTVSASP
jgi:hypothetical protein